MAKLPELLRLAIVQTLQVQDTDSEAYRAWLKDPTGPFSPMVPAADNTGSYPTTAQAMQIPVHRGQSFRRIADSIPVIADSF